MPRMTDAELARLETSVTSGDDDTAASLLYKHLLYYHYDCSWCDLSASFPTLSIKDACFLLELSSLEGLSGKGKRAEEDRYDFSIDSERVRLRRGYCKVLTGMMGAVWCDRVWEYLLTCGCLENVGVEIEQVELHCPKPKQFVSSVTLQSVLETDYRFDVIPFHTHTNRKDWTSEVFPNVHRESEYRMMMKNMNVPSCTYSTSDRNAHLATSAPTFDRPGYSTTTNMGLSTQGWTDVKTKFANFTDSKVPTTNHRQTSTIKHRLAYSVYVYIRENPVYTFQFRGATNNLDGELGVGNIGPQRTLDESGKQNLLPGGRRKLKATDAGMVADTSGGPAVQRYNAGICAAAGAIYRQRMPVEDCLSVLVFSFCELVGNNADADLAAYIALRIGLQRCLENGFHPLIIQSDNLVVMRYLEEGFVRTLGNYKQKDLHGLVAPMLVELARMNDFHQEALLAATTVKYLDKNKLRAERMASVVLQPVGTLEINDIVIQGCSTVIAKGEAIDRGWKSDGY